MSGQASTQLPPKPEKVYRKMYYIRALFAVIGGIITGALNIWSELGILVGILFFFISYIMFRYVIFRVIPDPKKYYMTGIFSFFLLWFVFWVVSINLIYTVTAI